MKKHHTILAVVLCACLYLVIGTADHNPDDKNSLGSAESHLNNTSKANLINS